MIVMFADVQVLNPSLGLIGMRFDSLPQCVKSICVKWSVDGSPVNGFFTRWFSDHKAIRWGSAGARAGFHSQCAGVRQHALSACQCHVDQVR